MRVASREIPSGGESSRNAASAGLVATVAAMPVAAVMPAINTVGMTMPVSAVITRTRIKSEIKRHRRTLHVHHARRRFDVNYLRLLLDIHHLRRGRRHRLHDRRRSGRNRRRLDHGGRLNDGCGLAINDLRR